MPFPLIAGIIGAAAPLIGSFFSSDKQEVVNAGIQFASTALGCPPTEKSIQDALANDPDALVKLKEYESNERISIGQQKVELERIYAEDRKSARVDGNVILQFIVGGAVIILAIVSLIAILWILKQPASIDNTVVVALLGSYVGGVMTEFGRLATFCFGSTSSSRTKDEMIYKSTPVR